MQTSLDVLLLNAHLCPPVNALYGTTSPQFVLSRIHHFGGKLWQLRSVRVWGQACYHVLPFVINTGGSSWDTPIIGDPALRTLGIGRDDVRVVTRQSLRVCNHCLSPDRVHDDVFELPNPIGRIRQPLALEWDRQRTDNGLRMGTYDERMNLIGHELAECIVCANMVVKQVVAQHLTREAAVDGLRAAFEDLGSTHEAAAREIDALLCAPSASLGLWTADTLPLAQ